MNHNLASLAKAVITDRQVARNLARQTGRTTREIVTLARDFDAVADQVELDGDPNDLLSIITAPTLATLASEVQAIARQCGQYVTRETPEDERWTDLRLYLHTAGYRLDWGDSQGDLDHRGYCGTASINSSERATMKQAREAAAELLADALDCYAQQNHIPPAVEAWLDLVTQEHRR